MAGDCQDQRRRAGNGGEDLEHTILIAIDRRSVITARSGDDRFGRGVGSFPLRPL